MNFRNVQPTDFLETVFFCCLDYKYQGGNLRKFDFHGKNHESPIKYIFSHVYLSKYCEFWNMFWTNIYNKRYRLYQNTYFKLDQFSCRWYFSRKREWSWKVVTRCLKKRPLQNSVSFHQLCYRFPGKLLSISEKFIEHKICIFT